MIMNSTISSHAQKRKTERVFNHVMFFLFFLWNNMAILSTESKNKLKIYIANANTFNKILFKSLEK